MLAVCCIQSSAFASAPAKPPIDLHQHPTAGKIPIDVAIGLYITNLASIDETPENFEVGGYLTAKWKDPRLALPLDQDRNDEATTRTLRVEDVWTPPIEAANSVSHKTRSYFMEVDRNGLVTYTEAFNAVLSNNYDLRKFPFDTQVLQFEFQPFLSSSAAIQFAAQPLPLTGITSEQHTELAAWRVKRLQYTAEKMTSDEIVPATREALFQVVIERRSGFYIWKILLPLLMMTLIPSVVFWLDVKEFDWALKVPMTMLLAMVAFEFAVARDLPRIGYLTFLDAVFLTSFVFCFMSIGEITLVFLMQKEGKRIQAAKLRSAGRGIYPLSYFGVLLLLAVRFLT